MFQNFYAHLLVVLLGALASANANVEVGQPAPNFTASDIMQSTLNLESLKGKYVVLEWFNIGCPYVRKHYNNNDMQNLQKELLAKNVHWISVNSTNPKHQDYRDAEQSKTLLTKLGASPSNFILDQDGSIGKSFEAKTTPHIFIINPEGLIVYRGAIDDTPDVDADPKKANNFILQAINQLHANAKVKLAETKPYGCSIKYAE